MHTYAAEASAVCEKSRRSVGVPIQVTKRKKSFTHADLEKGIDKIEEQTYS